VTETELPPANPARVRETLPRAGHPVADLHRFLRGVWRMTRLGWDGGGPGRTMRLRGTARFSACAEGLLLEERGTATIGAYQGEAARRTLFRFRTKAAADICFEDGRFFHRLDLAGGVAQVRHECGPDRYIGRYRVLDPGCWVLSWRVIGPRKRQLITSRFVRMPHAG
jgi:hypothetical protein